MIAVFGPFSRAVLSGDKGCARTGKIAGDDFLLETNALLTIY